MHRKLSLPFVLGIVAVVAVISFVIGSFAFAQENSSPGTISGEGMPDSQEMAPIPVPGGPGFVSLNPFVFQPWSLSYTYAYYLQALYNTTSGQMATFIGDIQLPDHASINKFTLYYYDNGPSNIAAYFVLCNLQVIGCTPIGEVDSADAVDAARNVQYSFSPPLVVDKQVNNYIVQVQLPTSSLYQLLGVRLDYSYPSGLPLLLK